MSGRLSLALALVVAAAGSVAAQDARVPFTPPDRPHVLLLDAVAGGLPADPDEAAAFAAGLRGAFEPDLYLTEGATEGPPRLTMPLANRFRLVHGEPFGDEWRVQVTLLGWVRATPGSADSLPGLRVALTVRSPAVAAAGMAGEASREELRFEVPDRPRAAWYGHAGRAVGLLVVEALHRRTGDLEADTRVRNDGTTRRPFRAPRTPAPAR